MGKSAEWKRWKRFIWRVLMTSAWLTILLGMFAAYQNHGIGF